MVRAALAGLVVGDLDVGVQLHVLLHQVLVAEFGEGADGELDRPPPSSRRPRRTRLGTAARADSRGGGQHGDGGVACPRECVSHVRPLAERDHTDSGSAPRTSAECDRPWPVAGCVKMPCRPALSRERSQSQIGDERVMAVDAAPQTGRPTLEDVAAHAGVSRSTASRALNDDSYVSARAREKVHAAAAASLGYSPNHAARSLVTRRTGAVAVVLSEAGGHGAGRPVLRDRGARGVTRVGRRGQPDAGDVRRHRRRRARHRRASWTADTSTARWSSRSHEGDPLPAALCTLRLPVVFGGPAGTWQQGRARGRLRQPSGARRPWEHLIAQGRRHIAMVAGPAGPSWRRRTGSRGGARRCGAQDAWDPCTSRATSRSTGGRLAMRKLLHRKRRAWTRVFAASDLMAAGAMRALEAGQQMPGRRGGDRLRRQPGARPGHDAAADLGASGSAGAGAADGGDAHGAAGRPEVTPARHMLGVSLTLRESG